MNQSAPPGPMPPQPGLEREWSGAPAPAPAPTEAPKPANPEPLQPQIDPEKGPVKTGPGRPEHPAP